MTVQAVAHLNVRGEARAGLELYRSAFGGELTLATYAAMHSAEKPQDADLVMWGQVAAESGFKVMAFDVTDKLPFDKGQNAFYVAVRFDAEAPAQAACQSSSRFSYTSSPRSRAPATRGR